MSVLRCLMGKAESGLIRRDAAERLAAALEERRAALEAASGPAERLADYVALEIADAATRAAARKADLTLRSIQAQIATLEIVTAYTARVRELRETPGDFGFGSKAPFLLANESRSPLWPAIRSLFWKDPHEIAQHGNVHYLARTIRASALAGMTDMMEALRPKVLGLRRETAHEFDLLKAAFREADATPEARLWADQFSTAARDLFDQFNAAGGHIPHRESWRMPNPSLDRTKIAAVARETFVQEMTPRLARGDMIDFTTGKPLDDAGLARVLGEVHDNAVRNWTEGPPSSDFAGREMLANTRRHHRVLSFATADDWAWFAQRYGEHDSPFDAMMTHVNEMAADIAMLRVLGPNPEGLKRYILSLFDRELETVTVTAPANADAATQKAAVKANRKAQDRLARQKRSFEVLWSHATGTADTPVNVASAHLMGDMRSVLVSSQMGSALLASLSDSGTVAMTARFNGIPAMSVIRRAMGDMIEPGSEMRAAQHGLIADSLIQGLHAVDRFGGETLRAGRAGQIASATIRASGLRRWSGVLRNAFGLETMALHAREVQKTFADLDPAMRESLGRYGIEPAEWDLIRSAPLHEERPGAFLLRPDDVRGLGGETASRAADKLKRLIETEMDYAVIDRDPMTRALIYGDSRPGTVEGEVRRAFGLYKSFPVTFLLNHFGRALARGWDGSRLGHSAILFTAMWGLGILSMQSKQVFAGRDPYSLDPTTKEGQRAFAAGLLQGGGLGIFGDFLAADQTRYGNTFVATLAGPQFAAGEKVLGDFVLGNVQRSLKGEPTHFLGDALYAGAGLIPGSSLWYGRLAFQRGVLDQLALMIDERAPERFRRLEEQAAKDFSQQFWWRPGDATPGRLPDLGGAR